MFFNKQFSSLTIIIFLLSSMGYGMSTKLRNYHNTAKRQHWPRTIAYMGNNQSPVLKKLQAVKPKYERLIIVLIPSYNNKEWYPINLSSVFAQKYKNYQIIYIDDNSPDGTGALVAQYIKDKKMEGKVTLIRNKQRLYAAENRYNAIHSCPDHAIIVNLDGDDWFLRDDVLSIINKAYENPDVWLTYGQFINWPTNKLGYGHELPSDVIENRTVRTYKNKRGEFQWEIGQPRTFYAWLFKQIKKENFMYKGSFFTAATDVAMMIPIIEMVGNKLLFIPDIFYMRNVNTEENVFKTNRKVQKTYGDFVYKGKIYNQIKQLPFTNLTGAMPKHN